MPERGRMFYASGIRHIAIYLLSRSSSSSSCLSHILDSMDDVPVFRALKRRKTAAKSVTRRSDSISDEESVPALSGIRNQLKPRHQGVQFSNSIPASRGQDDEASRDLVFGGEHELNAQAGGLLSRFVGSGSGSQIENVDKHMYVTSNIESCLLPP